MVDWSVKATKQKEKMNIKHPLFNPKNWTKDQRESAALIGVLLGLAVLPAISAFLLPANLFFVSIGLILSSLSLIGLAVTGFIVEFWEERNRFK